LLYHYGVGVDCHAKFYQVCLLIRQSTQLVCHEWTVPTRWPALAEAKHTVLTTLESAGVSVRAQELRYTLESTSLYHMPICLSWKGKPSIINPSDTAHVRRKTDVLDGRKLAHHSLTGLWRESWVADDPIIEIRLLSGYRARLISERNRLSNRINGVLLRYGHTVGQLGAINGAVVRALIEDFCRTGRVAVHGDYFSDQRLPGGVLAMLEQQWARIDQLTAQIQAIERMTLEKIDDARWVIAGGAVVTGDVLRGHLQSVPGVGPWTAVVWLAEVGDITRFSHVKKLCAFAGLDPSVKVSAGKVTAAGTCRGNRRLSTALRHAARGCLACADGGRLAAWARAYQGRTKNGSKGRALQALARRICRALYFIHQRCEPFDESRYQPLLGLSSYPQCGVESMGFPARVVAILKAQGLLTSRQVVEAFSTDLSRRPGCGRATIQAVGSWINQQRSRAREGLPERVAEDPSAG
jgi:transposase